MMVAETLTNKNRKVKNFIAAKIKIIIKKTIRRGWVMSNRNLAICICCTALPVIQHRAIPETIISLQYNFADFVYLFFLHFNLKL